MSFQILCWVFVLGGLGTIIRYGFQNMDFLDAAIELLFINGFGSFFIAGIYRLNPQNLAWKTGLTVGFCGGWTTMSAFSAICVQIFENQSLAVCLLYMMVHIAFGLFACWFGYGLFCRERRNGMWSYCLFQAVSVHYFVMPFHFGCFVFICLRKYRVL